MMVTNMAAEIINYYGNEEQKKEHIPKIMDGTYIAGAFGLSEPEYGSDAGSLRTTAIKDGDYYVINGNKAWITNGGYAGIFIVFARTNLEIKGPKGISAILVKPETEGFTIGKEENKMGLKSSSTVSLSFDNVRVHKSNLLGKEGEGFKIAMTALDGGRIGVASQALGIGLAALEEAKNYTKERKQFGKRISEFQAIQWMLADSATELEAARMLIMQAAYLKEEGNKRFTKEAAMAKYFATETANRVTARAIQMLGGYGYTEDFNLERYYRDVRVTTIYEGTSQIQQLVIGREILKD
jgi:butyryl-CoA dehydrogenase